MSLEKVTLDNGLTVYNSRIPGEYTNAVTMFVPYGSVHEELGYEGAAYAFENCVHIETDDYKSQKELDSHAKLNGMETNASTAYTRTLYLANGLGLEPNIAHLSQILQHTHFPEQGVSDEMKAIRREAMTDLDDAEGQHTVALSYAMFGNPYGRSIIGYHDKLDFSSETLKKLHERYYKLGRMSLVVSGKAKLDEIVTLANRYFEADETPYDDSNSPVLTMVPGNEKLTGLVREDSQNVYVSISHPMSPEFRDRFNSNRLALCIASSAMNGACFEELRYKKGISYNGGLVPDSYNHPNAWSVEGYVTTDKESVPVARTVIEEMFMRDNTHYTNEEIMGSLATYKYSFNLTSTSLNGRVQSIVSRLQSGREPIDIAESMRQLKKTTVADVRAAIDEIVEFAANTPQYTHLTGKRDAIGDVERIIDGDEIS